MDKRDQARAAFPTVAAFVDRLRAEGFDPAIGRMEEDGREAWNKDYRRQVEANPEVWVIPYIETELDKTPDKNDRVYIGFPYERGE